jgi:drug/metabolite transporter (DMT)-like permease
MPELAVLLVLLAAFLHAAWNAALKGGGDTFSTVRVLLIAEFVIAAAIAPFAKFPATASWPWLAVTAVAHVAYWLTLVDAYRHGELSEVYPIARGGAPMLVALGAALVAAELPRAPALVGVVLVSLGVLAMRRSGARRMPLRAFLMSVLTAISIATYSVADGMGVRASGDAIGFIAWSFVGSSLFTLVALRLMRIEFRPLARRDYGKAGFAGAASMAAYGIAIWAMSVLPIALVSALRETSVVFAVLFGRLFFREAVGPWRIGACLVIAGGAALLAIYR